MFAYASDATDAAYGFLEKLNDIIIFPLIAFLMTLALVLFLWGAFEYVMGAGSEAARSKGRIHIIYGLLGMLVMVSAYAILSIAAGTFGISAY